MRRCIPRLAAHKWIGAQWRKWLAALGALLCCGLASAQAPSLSLESLPRPATPPPERSIVVPSQVLRWRREALAYEHGDGVARDSVAAAQLYCRAARYGDAEAQFNLAWMLTNARGIERDDVQAAHLFAAAAEQGLAQAQNMARDYLRVIFLGLPFSMLGVLIQMSLRGTGDSVTPLWFMALSVAIDSTFNPLLIDGIGPFPKMGIAGSATATLLAGIISSAGLLIYVYWRDLPIRLRGHELRYLIPDKALVKTILAKGLPMGAQMLVMSTAGLTMIGLVNRHGVETAAAYAVSQQLWTYIQMPAMAIGVAVSSMAAQNIGAGKWERVNAITRSGIVYNTIITLVVIAAIILFDRQVMTLFVGSGSPAIPIARHIQLISSWTFVMFGATMVLFSTVRANGATVPPLVILAIAFYPVRLGFAILGQPLIGADALWYAFPIGSMVSLLLAAWYYRSGHWREQMLIVPPEPEAEEHAHGTSEPAGRLHPTG